MAFSLILSIIVLVFKNLKVKKFICNLTYILYMFPFLHFNLLILHINNSSKLLILSAFFIILIRGVMILLFLQHPTNFYLSLLIIIVHAIYNSFLDDFIEIVFVIIELISISIISYFLTQQYKYNIYSKFCLEEKNRWYDNLFEHLNSGFISFNNKGINIINKCLLEYLSRNEQIFEEPKRTENANIVVNERTITNVDLLPNILKFNSGKVLNILLSNINEEYLNRDTSIQKNNFNEELQIDNFLNHFKATYLKADLKDKFLFIGYKDMEIGTNTCTICLTANKKTSCSNCNVNNKNKEVRRFEIFIRCHNQKEDDEVEIIFNDISKIKELEEKSAELNYKTIFLSKVAHEFKNPLICISELVNDIQDNHLRITLNDNNINNFSSSQQKTFKHIKSMSNYLLLLIKDFNYFSQLQIKKLAPALEMSEVIMDEIIETCTNMAEVLIFKFSKNRVQFLIENNFLYIVRLVTDSVKLQQILINLISNAIKFTNDGFIKLIISFNPISNNLEFRVEDTGIGLSNEQIENIYTPFNKGKCNGENKYGTGLGLYIVTQMLIDLGSILEIKSEVGNGSAFYFSLPALIVNTDEVNNSSYNELITIDENFAPNLSIIRTHRNHLKSYLSESNLFSSPKKERKLTVEDIEIVKCNLFNDEEKETDLYIVIDDERLTRSSTIRVLRRCAEKMNKKIDIIEAEDGLDCLYQAYISLKKGVKIKGIISDEMMIHMNGTTTAEVFRKIKNLNTHTIPFYLITAYPEVQSQFVNSIFTKPLSDRIACNILEDVNYLQLKL